MTQMAENKEMTSHVATYGRMIGMLKWGGVAVFLLTAAIIWLIA